MTYEKRVQQFPLPPTPDETLALLQRALTTSYVKQIKLTERDITVERMMDPDDRSPVVDLETDLSLIDFDVLISMFEPEELTVSYGHPLLDLVQACALLSARGLRPAAIMAPNADTLAGYLGFGDPSIVSTHALGMRAVYANNDHFPDKIVVVGSKSGMLYDTAVGIIIDLGD